MKILFAASEVAPFSQSGGLGDVAGSLPKALAALGHEVCVVSPYYSAIRAELKAGMKYVGSFNVNLGWRNLYCGVFSCRRESVDYYFLDNEYYFARDGHYGYYDDGERFAFFSKAVLTMLFAFDLSFDVIHANDWHTALIPIYLRTVYRDSALASAKTVFTIHNIQYQGQYDPIIMGDLFGLDVCFRPLLEYAGCLNLMKAAICCCDALTTVSPTYAGEITGPEHSYGLHYIINDNRGKLSGIINGIDYDFYSPENDTHIKSNYSAKNLRGKAYDKAALQTELGLSVIADIPVVAMVGRLVDHKGAGLVCRVFERLMQRGLQFVLLGSGDYNYERFFSDWADKYPGRAAVRIGFDSSLARRIYAGADLFLMPSASEPCGLAQMIAMRYATVPVVHSTGGLRDTVTDCRLGSGNGFCFEDFTEDGLLSALDTALGVYCEKTDWNSLRKYAASCDFGWKNSALRYEQLYKSITE